MTWEELKTTLEKQEWSFYFNECLIKETNANLYRIYEDGLVTIDIEDTYELPIYKSEDYKNVLNFITALTKGNELK